MIDTALTYIRDLLNENFKNEFSSPDKKVVLSNIIKADGTPAQKVDEKIVFFLVNLDEESTLKNSTNRSGLGSSFLHSKPALHLNMYILFCANFDSSLYIEGLQYLSAIIRFFQINKKIEVNFSSGTGQRINTLNFELCKLDYDQLSHIWSAIGSKLMPSVVYKVGLLVFDDTPISKIIPAIRNPENKP